MDQHAIHFAKSKSHEGHIEQLREFLKSPICLENVESGQKC